MKSLYWILGIVILGLVLYMVWPKEDSTNLPNQNDNDTNTETETDNDHEGVSSITVNLGTQNSSGQQGKAVLTEVAGKTQVVVTMTGGSFTAPQPAHIHVGACPTPGAVKYGLTNLVAGASTTTIDATIEQLRTSLPLAINVHKSAAETNVYTACGDLKF